MAKGVKSFPVDGIIRVAGMGSLDAYKDEIFSELVNGDWKSLFPKSLYTDIQEWAKKQETDVIFRFTFCQPPDNSRYAVYIRCDADLSHDKVKIRDIIAPTHDDPPLAIPPNLYDYPLFCIPRDFLQRVLKKKRGK